MNTHTHTYSTILGCYFNGA